MLKDFLKERQISIYKLAQISGIPYSTLNDIVNYKVDIANIRAGYVFRLAEELHVSMDEFYGLCSNEIVVYSEKFSVKGRVCIKNKKYFLTFQYYDKKYEEELYPVKREATMFIHDIAMWQMEKHIADIELEKNYELYIKEKR